MLHERAADRRLRAALRLPLGRAREPGRLGRLAVLAPLRQPVGVRPPARRRGRALVDPRGRRPTEVDAALPRPRRWCSRPRSARRPARVALVDALAIGPQRARPRARRRRARGCCCAASTCTEGEVELELEFAPRPEYGLVAPAAVGRRRRRHCPRRRRRARAVVARSPLDVDDATATGALHAAARGQRWRSRLQHRADVAGAAAAVLVARTRSTTRLDDTVEAWRTWSRAAPGYEGPWRDLVHHSGRVLQALTY